MDLGVGISGNVYVGDLNYKFYNIRNVYPGVTISTRFSRKDHFYSAFNLSYTSLSEQLHDGEQLVVNGPDYKASPFFSTKIYSLDYRLQYILLKKPNFSPYFKAGIGLMRFTPTDINGVNLATNLYSRPEIESYAVFNYYAPLAFGFQYKINSQLWMNIDYTHYFLGTDYLDNIGSIGAKQGNDYYQAIQVTVCVRISEGRANNNFPIIADIKPDQRPKPPKYEGPAKLAKDHSKIYKSKKSLTFKDYNRKKSKSAPPERPEPVVAAAKPKAKAPEKSVTFNAYELSKSDNPVLSMSPISKETAERQKQAIIAEKEQEYLKKNRWTQYYVQEGDSWESIANEYNLMPEVLKKLNGAENGNKAAQGRKIRIPKE